MKYAENLTQLIGNTPLVKLQKFSEETGALVLGKCEFMNPTHSVKDRIGTNMINTALEEGKITTSTTIIEPTSGNTGIALASVCAALGIKLIDSKAKNHVLNILFDEEKKNTKELFDITLEQLDEYQDKYNEFLHYSI